MSQQQFNQRIILGGFIIALGVLALIDRLGIFSIGNIFQFWPTVFVVIGLLKIAGSKSRSSIVTGSIFIAIGVVMMLNSLGIIHFSWHDWWPVILIGVGLMIVFKDRSHSCEASETSQSFLSGDELKSGNSVLDITAIMGGNETVNNSPDFRGGELTAIMGGVELDLRGASIQTDAVLNLWATWGGIVLKIPGDWVVVNRCTAIMGGIEDKSFASPASTKRLIITGTVIMGGVEIKN